MCILTFVDLKKISVSDVFASLNPLLLIIVYAIGHKENLNIKEVSSCGLF